MAIATLGAVDVPIYPALTPPQISCILNDSGAKIVVVSNARIMKQIDGSAPARRRIFHWAISVGKEYARQRHQNSVSPLTRIQVALADRLVFSKLKERTGGRIRFFVSGGAALSKDIGEFFEAVGIMIVEGYGLTETSPVLTRNRVDDYKFGTVGKPIPGAEIKLAEDGEILAKGSNIMAGYFHNPQATAEVIDSDGWFHTGDVGMFDPQGHLMITDRKKHLFVSSGGKNIAPQPIESLFLQSKFIDQFVLVGDGRMLLTALIVPEFETLREHAQTLGVEFSRDADLIRIEKIRRMYEKEIQQLQQDLPTFERVRRFELLPEQLTVENGEITPTLKVKRKVVERNSRISSRECTRIFPGPGQRTSKGFLRGQAPRPSLCAEQRFNLFWAKELTVPAPSGAAESCR